MNPGLRAVEGPAPKAFSEQETRSLDRDIQINRLCKPANPAFTISKISSMRAHLDAGACSKYRYSVADTRSCLAGGADRDRTDDLKLAKLALSQLSYGPRDRRSADRGSAAQVGLPSRSCGRKPVFAPRGSDAAAFAALQRRLVGPGRVERPTSRLSGVRS